MTKGFEKGDIEVEFEVPKDEIQRLIKKYKKIKKYARSNIFELKSMYGTEKIVSSLIEEAEENPLE